MPISATGAVAPPFRSPAGRAVASRRPAPPPPSACLVTDLDRTLTRGDLSLDPRALAAVARLRRHGVLCILASGRAASDLPEPEALAQGFDGFILEGGAVWGRPGRWSSTPDARAVWSCAAALAAEGHAIQRRTASFGAPRAAEAQARRQPGCAIHANQDAIDVTPAGVDKASGLEAWMAAAGARPGWLVAIGDGENDLPLMRRADEGWAVANAAPSLLAAATAVAAAPFSDGFLEAVRAAFPEVLP